jgi:hypothetical protein
VNGQRFSTSRSPRALHVTTEDPSHSADPCGQGAGITAAPASTLLPATPASIAFPEFGGSGFAAVPEAPALPLPACGIIAAPDPAALLVFVLSDDVFSIASSRFEQSPSGQGSVVGGAHAFPRPVSMQRFPAVHWLSLPHVVLHKP